MIRINSFFEMEEGKVQESLRLARELVQASLNEKGCKGYDIFHSATRPDVMMFCETWENAEDLKVHRETEHFKRLVPQIKQYAADYKAEKFEF